MKALAQRVGDNIVALVLLLVAALVLLPLTCVLLPLEFIRDRTHRWCNRVAANTDLRIKSRSK